MTKTFTPKPGDKWTRDKDGMLWVYREDCAVVFSRTGFTSGSVTCRSAHERDLPTRAAHAQLREWGYEVSGDKQPLTESRVREIVAQMLAAHPTPAEVRDAGGRIKERKWQVKGEWSMKRVPLHVIRKWVREVSPLYAGLGYAVKCRFQEKLEEGAIDEAARYLHGSPSNPKPKSKPRSGGKRG